MSSPSRLFDLTGKVAVVTGAAGQLGGEYVRALLGAGAAVAALDVWPENPKSTLHGLPADRSLVLKVDVTRKADLGRSLDEITARLGRPHVLVNNAGIDAPPNATDQATGPFEEYPESAWDAMMEVNLKGVFLCCQVFGTDMAESGGGSIVNIASIYGVLSPDQRLYAYRAQSGKPFVKPVAYSVTKSGILNLTRYLATYWAGRHVRVNTLTLGGVFNHQDAAFLEGYCDKVPLGRMARADEYNGAILFLASDASSYMTGSNLVIDGGFSAW
jgi:NAD(P)-dependent dehydrogenase (short-subunit alcohol dehydrogenase family)